MRYNAENAKTSGEYVVLYVFAGDLCIMYVFSARAVEGASPYYLVTAKTLAVILSEAKDLEESRKRFFVAYAPQNDKFKV